MPGMNLVDGLGLTNSTSSGYEAELEMKRIKLEDYSSNAMTEIRELACRVSAITSHFLPLI